jgi:hypothetical protein
MPTNTMDMESMKENFVSFIIFIVIIIIVIRECSQSSGQEGIGFLLYINALLLL